MSICYRTERSINLNIIINRQAQNGRVAKPNLINSNFDVLNELTRGELLGPQNPKMFSLRKKAWKVPFLTVQLLVVVDLVRTSIALKREEYI